MKVRSDADLEQLRKEGLSSLYPQRTKITVGMATCGRAAGAGEVFACFRDEIPGRKLDVSLAATGCLGLCQQEPLVAVQRPGLPRYVYSRVDRELAMEILDRIATGNLPERGLFARVCEDRLLLTGERVRLAEEPEEGVAGLEQVPFFARQVKVATRNCGYIDPGSIAEYAARGGYLALRKALSMEPEEVIAEVSRSGLRGRGGGGFPTGRKWLLTRQATGEEKYVICNADEGDPGAYMDRSILEGDPHAVLEGMIIGGYAIGAGKGIIYVRSEYPLAVAAIQEAIRQAEEYGLLGDDIFGSGFGFRITVVKGQGAFICGEETALIAAVEGKMGEPRPRPPYPAEHGLWGKPTCINNVETWANIAPIIVLGSEWFAGMGTESSRGTKVFSLVGNIRNNGLIEVPMGTTLREIVYEIGGGTGRFELKAVQTGGPSGGCIPAGMIDLPVDYEALTRAGSIMGSGGMVVMDERSCMVDVARFFLGFTSAESCGKCLPCREGTRQMLEILERICAGQAEISDLELLGELAHTVRETSLCGLGQTAPSPVLSTLRHFRGEYETHIRERFCPAGVCTGLLQFVIDEEKCQRCGRCVRACPQGAIAGERGEKHRLDPRRCVRCRACLEACRYRAIKAVPREV